MAFQGFRTFLIGWLKMPIPSLKTTQNWKNIPFCSAETCTWVIMITLGQDCDKGPDLLKLHQKIF